MVQRDAFGSQKGPLVGVGLGVWVAHSAPRRWRRSNPVVFRRPSLVARRLDGYDVAPPGLASKFVPAA